MKAALIKNGIVENVIIVSPTYVAPAGFDVVEIATNDLVSIGDRYENDQFHSAEIIEPVPFSVTPLQIRKALRQLGLKQAVDAFVASISDEEIVEEWEYATAIERGNPFLNQAAIQLGMSTAQVDDVFRLASKLV